MILMHLKITIIQREQKFVNVNKNLQMLQIFSTFGRSLFRQVSRQLKADVVRYSLYGALTFQTSQVHRIYKQTNPGSCLYFYMSGFGIC